MTVANHIKEALAGSSLIREMFEKGAELKKIHGPENVFDLSLGNPNLDPPPEFLKALITAASSTEPGIHGYMPNTGYASTRRAVAGFVAEQQEINDLPPGNIIMTCGAAGALNVTFKTLLNPGDEVIVPSPYFVEYGFYAANSSGHLVTVKTNSDFTLNFAAIEEAIGEKTKIVLINSPNNPTGQIYSEESLDALGKLLREKSREVGHTIYLVSDEPYRRIVYDNVKIPSIFSSYEESIVITSFSKDLSIPGERIGYIAVSPKLSEHREVLIGMALTNRTLGFVNAPALMQRALPAAIHARVNIEEYARKRKLLCEGLAAAGYEFITPPGAFYLFPKCPGGDDMLFVKALQEENIIVVPGRAFDSPGFFRIAFCVDDTTITGSLPGFKKVLERFKS
ncbi:pyridoxal phosphate-dependent aminotransferase [Desulfomarina sp.]